MPNHVVNEILFEDLTPAQIVEVKKAILNGENRIDFSVLLPAPLNAWMGNSGINHEKTFKLIGLDWCRQNWGTKWNAYAAKPIEETGSTLRLVFETAWNPPYGWLCALFNRFRLPFAYRSLSEGWSRGLVGRFWMDADIGPQWEEQETNDEINRHLYVLQWGDAAGRILNERSDES